MGQEAYDLVTKLPPLPEEGGGKARQGLGVTPVSSANSITASIDERLLRAFAEILEEKGIDRYADKPLRRIPEQFNPENPDPARLSIDVEFLKALNPSLDDAELEKALKDLYGHVNVAFRNWIGGTSRGERKYESH